jgi:hypothetical protein
MSKACRKVISVKRNPDLWEVAKERACKESRLCKHSARKMQVATSLYKKMGGKYVGQKSPCNSMAIWTKERWRTADGSKSGGKKRYNPDKVWKHLSRSQIKQTNQMKLDGFLSGKQFVSQPKDVIRIARKIRYKKL